MVAPRLKVRLLKADMDLWEDEGEGCKDIYMVNITTFAQIIEAFFLFLKS